MNSVTVADLIIITLPFHQVFYWLKAAQYINYKWVTITYK